MESTAISDLLVEVRELIEKGWCQNNFAQDSRGMEVDAFSDQACKFCIEGAILRVVRNSYTRQDIRTIIYKALGYSIYSLASWNDTFGRTQEDIVGAINRALNLV